MLTFGTEITDDYRQDQTNFDFAFGSADPESIWGAHDLCRIRPTGFTDRPKDFFQIQASRYDHYSDASGATTNPRFGLLYHPSISTTAKFLYGSAFRSPMPYETNPDYGPFYEANFALQPEKIKSAEGILEQSFAKNVTATGSFFYNRITNLIILQTDETTGLAVYENAGHHGERRRGRIERASWRGAHRPR